nr:hypothetical protein [Cedecea sp. NFIX57]
MQRWQPGEVLLSDFDIKIGRLSASVRKKTLTRSDVESACSDADNAVRRMMRKDHDSSKRSAN